AEKPLFGPAGAAGQEETLHVIEEQHRAAHRIVLMPMALEFALAGEREELAELLLAVAIATASDVRPVDDDEHDVVAARMLVPLAVMLVGDLLATEQTAKLIGQAAGHRRLTDADPTVKKEALEGAAGDLVAPLMGHDRRGLRQHVPIS